MGALQQKMYIYGEFPRIKKHPKSLNNLNLIFNKKLHCVIEGEESKTVIFTKNGEITISKSGIVLEGTFKVLNSELITINDGENCLYDLIFFDTTVLILKKNGTDNHKLFLNKDEFTAPEVSLRSVLKFLYKKYFIVIDSPQKPSNTNLLKIKDLKRGYNFKMGYYSKHSVEISGKNIFFYKKTSINRFYVYHKNKIIMFDSVDSCLNYLVNFSQGNFE